MDAVLHKPFSVKKLAECLGAFLEPSEEQPADQLVREPRSGTSCALGHSLGNKRKGT
jgi:hypothetical protein